MPTYSGMISPLLRQNCSSVCSPSEDKYGDVVYTTTLENQKCRFVNKPLVVFSPTGAMEIARAQMWLKPDVTIEEQYRVRYENDNYEIVGISKERDLSGKLMYLKVLLR